jgi:D-3-phosphoglycerate dehydrogenase / 2-oxoglutarate reductase
MPNILRLNATLFPVNDFEAGIWRAHGIVPRLVEAATPEALIEHVADCDGLVVVSASLPTRVVESMRKCRVISRRGAGTDKIDVAAATRMGIVVTNVPDFCVEEQADHSMAMLLMLLRHMPRMQRGLLRGDFARTRQISERNLRITGRTLGLVGFGLSAKALARRARGFGLRVLATRRDMRQSAEADALGVTLVELDTLLRESDFVSLHLPLGAESYHLLNEARLRAMKPGAYLINTSRGALVDEAALVRALQDDHLGGAGIDTFEGINVFADGETPPEHALVKLLDDESINLVLTPHVAAGSAQAMEDVSRGAIENLAGILNGRWPRPERIVNAGVAPRWPLL